MKRHLALLSAALVAPAIIGLALSAGSASATPAAASSAASSLASIAGNFLAAGLARWLSYRWAIVLLCLGYFGAMLATYSMPLDREELWYGLMAIGLCQGVFALFTMYLPPLFPTLLRTTGAGFCYNFGRIAAAFGTVYFGLYARVGDYRLPLLYAGFLFLPAAGVACLLPNPPDETRVP